MSVDPSCARKDVGTCAAPPPLSSVCPQLRTGLQQPFVRSRARSARDSKSGLSGSRTVSTAFSTPVESRRRRRANAPTRRVAKQGSAAVPRPGPDRGPKPSAYRRRDRLRSVNGERQVAQKKFRDCPMTCKNALPLYCRRAAENREGSSRGAISRRRALFLRLETTGDEKDIPTEYPAQEAQAWVSRAHEDASRASDIEKPPRKGSRPTVGLAGSG